MCAFINRKKTEEMNDEVEDDDRNSVNLPLKLRLSRLGVLNKPSLLLTFAGQCDIHLN